MEPAIAAKDAKCSIFPIVGQYVKALEAALNMGTSTDVRLSSLNSSGMVQAANVGCHARDKLNTLNIWVTDAANHWKLGQGRSNHVTRIVQI
ncbi:hypothetical protein GCM10023310_44660 [Paenibacillus vulneris]